MKECLLCGQLFALPFSFYQIFFVGAKQQEVICPHCLNKFMRLQGMRCPSCDRIMPRTDLCQDCLAWQKIYGAKTLKNHAFFAYNHAFHDLMVQYKRYGDYVLCQVLQALCQSELRKLPTYDFYVPIPTAPEHQARRRFDTIQAIFAPLLPLTLLLRKERGCQAQGQKNREERLRTGQSFYLNPTCPLTAKMERGSFLLLDDIYTTGRTLYHARDKINERFPQARIESFSICR